ncbi:MAG: DUF5615 family PIN-like protein [Terriglobia bacterium]
MRFLIDSQLPGALSRFLSSLGCDCLHVMKVGLGAAPDADIWRYPSGGRCLGTKAGEGHFSLIQAELISRVVLMPVRRCPNHFP